MVHDIKQKIEQQIEYAYMDQHIHKPIIQTEKIWFLSQVFKQLQMDQNKIEELIVPCILVETALDTHDGVKLDNEGEEPTVETQLTVLAGDYYSGLYYYLLSHSKEIPLVRVLARAIKLINELKMQLYNMNSFDYETFMNQHKNINSVVIKMVAKEYGFKANFEYIERWLMFEKLLREKFILLNVYHHSLYHKWFIDKSSLSLSEYTKMLKVDIHHEAFFFYNSIEKQDINLSFLENRVDYILQQLNYPEMMNKEGEHYEREG